MSGRFAGCYICGRIEFVDLGFKPHDLPCQRYKNPPHRSWDYLEHFIPRIVKKRQILMKKFNGGEIT